MLVSQDYVISLKKKTMNKIGDGKKTWPNHILDKNIYTYNMHTPSLCFMVVRYPIIYLSSYHV